MPSEAARPSILKDLVGSFLIEENLLLKGSFRMLKLKRLNEGFGANRIQSAISRRKLTIWLMPILLGLAALVPQRAFAQG